MEIKKFICNPIQENTYILWDETKECVVIDAGNATPQEDSAISQFIDEQGLKPVMAINTHCHFDHILGVEYLRATYGVKFAASTLDNEVLHNCTEHCSMFGINPCGLPSEVDVDLATSEKICFGTTTLQVIPSPGHTPGGVALYHAESKRLFTGDTLFRESIGRTDLPGGDYPTLMRSILNNIVPLGDEVEIYPGHAEKSSIGHESLYNPFVVEALNGVIQF